MKVSLEHALDVVQEFAVTVEAILTLLHYLKKLKRDNVAVLVQDRFDGSSVPVHYSLRLEVQWQDLGLGVSDFNYSFEEMLALFVQ